MKDSLKKKYAIIANPCSGTTTPRQKRVILHKASAILDATVYGLNTASAQEFLNLSIKVSKDYDVLVVAGGDGTFSEVMNAVDLSQIILAFLPLGSGNSLRYALGYRGHINDVARIIRNGTVREYDIIDCDSKMIMKHPYFGYGMKLMPGAEMDDGKLHVRAVTKNMLGALYLGATAFTIGNRWGAYDEVDNISIRLDKPLWVQVDGNIGWKTRDISFRIVRKRLRIKF